MLLCKLRQFVEGVWHELGPRRQIVFGVFIATLLAIKGWLDVFWIGNPHVTLQNCEIDWYTIKLMYAWLGVGIYGMVYIATAFSSAVVRLLFGIRAVRSGVPSFFITVILIAGLVLGGFLGGAVAVTGLLGLYMIFMYNRNKARFVLYKEHYIAYKNNITMECNGSRYKQSNRAGN